MNFKKTCFTIIMIMACISLNHTNVRAQGLGGETECGTDGKGEAFFSQYLFYDAKHYNILTRYFKIDGILERVEIAVGPTLKFGKESLLKLQLGGSTDKEIMLGAVLTHNIKDRAILYIFDAKLSTTQSVPTTVYQKIFVPIDKKGRVQYRMENLIENGNPSFLRIGLELQLQQDNNTWHLFAEPYFDPVRKGIGAHFGLRFF